MKGIKKWWRRIRWNSLARGCRDVRKHPEKYDINKLLGIKRPATGEVEKLRKLLDEYKKEIEGGVEDVRTEAKKH